MGEHTPGPWTVGFKSMDVTGLTEKGPMKVCDIRGWGHLTGKGHGALGLPDNAAIAIQEANARLIAAAPDLLEACASVWLMLSDTEDNELRLIADECRAAIAKAAAPQRDMQEVGG